MLKSSVQHQPSPYCSQSASLVSKGSASSIMHDLASQGISGAPPPTGDGKHGAKDISALFGHYADAVATSEWRSPVQAGSGVGETSFGGGNFGGGGAGGSWEEPKLALKAPAGKELKLQFMAFIPSRLGLPFHDKKAGQEKGLSNQAEYDAEVAAVPGSWGTEPGNLFTDYCFRTDDRGFGGGSYRLVSQASLNTSDLGNWNKDNPFEAETGPSERAWADVGFFSRVGHVQREQKKATPKGKRGAVSNAPNSTVFHAAAAAAYPFVKASPDIDISGTWKLTRPDAAGGGIHVELSGEHNDFPCYEVLVNGSSLYRFDTEGSGPNLWNLGIASTKFSASGIF